MGLFSIFKKKKSNNDFEPKNIKACTVPMSKKTLNCARCKKEIAESDAKWVGNHRFCSDCAAPFKSQSAFSSNYQPKFPEFKCSVCGNDLSIASRHKKLCPSCEWAQEKASDKKEIFKMITATGQTHILTYSGHTRYSPNHSSTSGYGSDDWIYLCEEKGVHFLLMFSDVASCGAMWRCTVLLEEDYQNLVEEDVKYWVNVANSRERSNIHGIRLSDIENVRHLLPISSRSRMLGDEDYIN